MSHDDTLQTTIGIATSALFVCAAVALVGACGADGSQSGAPTACTNGDSTNQRHGATCLCCHAEFGVAGSIDPDGVAVAAVVVTDARGAVATMSPNAFGNFFRHFAMEPPFQARVIGADGRERSMRALAPSGDCNGCHATGGVAAPITGP